MRKSVIYVCVLLLASLFSCCKTTEQNYRNAYQAAKENNRAKVDDNTDERIGEEAGGQKRNIGGVEVGVITDYFHVVDNDSIAPQKYGVVVGRFKQIFNARMFVKRLSGAQLPAYAAQDPAGEYFVVAKSFATQQEAGAFIKNIGKEIPFQLPIEPFVISQIGK